jgi:hypothetical protein
MTDTRNTVVSDAPHWRIFVGLAACAFLAAGLLWSRFGEEVYLTGIMTAIMNCF